MRISIIGDNATAHALRGLLTTSHVTLVEQGAELTLTVQEAAADTPHVLLDGVPGTLLEHAIAQISDQTALPLLLQLRDGHVFTDRALRVVLPAHDELRRALEVGLLRAVLRAMGHVGVTPVSRSRFRRVIAALGLGLVLLAGRPAAAQQTVTITGNDATSGAVVAHVADLLTNAIRVKCISGCAGGGGGGGTSAVDRAPFTFGTDSLTPAGGIFDDTPPTALSTGMAAAVRLTTQRAFHINLRTAGGTELGTASTPIRVDVTGTTTQPVSALSLPLPSGAATEATLGTLATQSTLSSVNAKLNSVITAPGNTVDPSSLLATAGKSVDDGSYWPLPLTGTTNTTTAVKVNGSAVTQPVSGTFWQTTQPVSGTVTVQQPTGSNLHIACDSGCGGAASFTDSSAFTAGTTAIGNLGAVFNDGLTAVTAGNAAAPRITNQRGLHVNLRNASGTEIGTSGTPLRIDPTGTTAQPVTGTFFQATQPVSLAAAVSVTGTFWQTTQPVSVATLPALTAGSAVIGHVIADSGSTTAVTSLPANATVNQTQVNGVAVSVGQGVSDTGTQRLVLAQETTYAAGTTLKTATAAGTGPFFSICGSASKTVRIQRLSITGTVATAAVYGDVILKRTSTATSGGTATTLTDLAYDSNDAAGTAVAKYYTVLATAGTSAGVVLAETIFFPITATVSAGMGMPQLVYMWRDQDAEAPTLRGTAQCLEANFGTTTANAPTLTVSVAWTEK